VQHFADLIIAERDVRYGRVAMIPTSAKTKRRPQAYSTIETPVIACPIWVNRVNLTKGGPLPVYPDQRTSSDRPGMSQTCHERTMPNCRLGPTDPSPHGTWIKQLLALHTCLMSGSWCTCAGTIMLERSYAGQRLKLYREVVEPRRLVGDAFGQFGPSNSRH